MTVSELLRSYDRAHGDTVEDGDFSTDAEYLSCVAPARPTSRPQNLRRGIDFERPSIMTSQSAVSNEVRQNETRDFAFVSGTSCVIRHTRNNCLG